MIRFVRTASIAPGKLGEALAFAKQVSDYLEKEYRQQLELMIPVGGNPHRIAWRAEYASLAALEEFQARTMSDPRYMQLLTQGATLFIAGSLNDAIWRTL
jgi:hypothetical protein